MILDMKETVEEGLKNINRMEEYIDNNFNNVKTKMCLHSWLDQIRRALSITLVNVREILNYDKKIRILTELSCAREEIRDVKEEVKDAKDLIENIQNQIKRNQKEFEEYHKKIILKFNKQWEE